MRRSSESESESLRSRVQAGSAREFVGQEWNSSFIVLYHEHLKTTWNRVYIYTYIQTYVDTHAHISSIWYVYGKNASTHKYMVTKIRHLKTDTKKLQAPTPLISRCKGNHSTHLCSLCQQRPTPRLAKPLSQSFSVFPLLYLPVAYVI
jgi:hypothetical protein